MKNRNPQGFMITPGAGLPDKFWEDVADHLSKRIRPRDLVLGPNEFLNIFPGLIASHVRKNMLGQFKVQHFIIHKGALDIIDPDYVLEASKLTPVFANEVFVVFSRRGEMLASAYKRHLTPFEDFLKSLTPRVTPDNQTAIVVTTYNRPSALRRSLPSLASAGFPIVVVDDGSSLRRRIMNWLITRAHRATYVLCPKNLGLAHAFNVGIAHWLAHPAIHWISIFNDDVQIIEGAFDVMDCVVRRSPYPEHNTLYSGYFSPHHPVIGQTTIGERTVFLTRSCTARHMHAHRSYWTEVSPIPTAYFGAPKETGGLFSGQGSDVDWWVASWAPKAAPKQGGHIVVLPDLVSTFLLGAKNSTWANED